MLLGKTLSTISFDGQDYFGDATILIVEHDDNGSLGFIVDRFSDNRLNDLVEFVDSPSIGLYEGGPMQQDRLYFIHRIDDVTVGGVLVREGLFWGGNFKKALELIHTGKSNANDIKIFVGYCGWDKGQLEDELKNDSWFIVERSLEDLFQ
ncbi:MAG: YqgE/AlgH family protein [Pseudopedobacter saltans]|uniref:YqgE/AlgH family protein n=1 Tax=Pseudopedobacter saltans TaxID=151895 RepID=A0A2W5F7K2_9SPHI|nr:MAG: YqgE/AlgH family protein [Pseudopedobacter saltans]